MNFLKQIFTNENTAYIGLCKFKTEKVSVGITPNNIRFSTPQRMYTTNFSKNRLRENYGSESGKSSSMFAKSDGLTFWIKSLNSCDSSSSFAVSVETEPEDRTLGDTRIGTSALIAIAIA